MHLYFTKFRLNKTLLNAKNQMERKLMKNVSKADECISLKVWLIYLFIYKFLFTVTCQVPNIASK